MKRLIIVTLTILLMACAQDYSEGERVGVVTKFSKKGLIFKSWEGSLNQGGTKTTYDEEGNSSLVTNAIDFNVSDPLVIEQIKEAANTRKPVKLIYSQWFFKPITIDNSRVITKVDFLD